MFNPIGTGRGIGGPLRHAIPGESFIRHVGDDKLIFNFKSGSGTTVKDRSREGNDGTFGAGAAAPTWRRNSLYFDGGDYVDLTGINHGISTGGFTLCFNVRDLAPGEQYFLDQEAARMLIYIVAASTIYLHPEKISDTQPYKFSPVTIKITRDGSGNIECYINGKPEGLGVTVSTDFTYDGTSNTMLFTRNSFDEGWVTGTIYSFRILNKCLSGIEAQNEYLCNKFRGNN